MSTCANAFSIDCKTISCIADSTMSTLGVVRFSDWFIGCTCLGTSDFSGASVFVSTTVCVCGGCDIVLCAAPFLFAF